MFFSKTFFQAFLTLNPVRPVPLGAFGVSKSRRIEVIARFALPPRIRSPASQAGLYVGRLVAL
jgi:hypothetical protein